MEDLVSTAERLNLTEFVEAVESVGLETTLRQENFTLFVPNNAAFEAILPDNNASEVGAILTLQHLTDNVVFAAIQCCIGR